MIEPRAVRAGREGGRGDTQQKHNEIGMSVSKPGRRRKNPLVSLRRRADFLNGKKKRWFEPKSQSNSDNSRVPSKKRHAWSRKTGLNSSAIPFTPLSEVVQ